MINIRTANKADIETIRTIAAITWGPTYGDIIGQEQIDYMLAQMYAPEVLSQQMDDGHTFLLALENETPIGFAGFSQTTDAIHKLHKIYVLPNQHGKGIGKLLLEEVKIAAQQANSNYLQLNVNRYNKAHDFYKKIGFSVIREEDIDIGNGFLMNDYVMQINIEPSAQ